jgi:D-alanine-D-alanine ligase
LRVVILHNAIPPDAPESEQDTLVQVEAVRAALLSRGHDVSVLACTLDLETCRSRLLQAQPTVVFNLVEGLGGADRLAVLAPALLDALRIPYTGNRTEPLCLSNHKLLTKQLLRAAGLPTPNWEGLSHAPLRNSATQAEESGRGMRTASAESLRAPYIVKSVSEHASFGLEDDLVVMADGGSDVQERLAAATRRLGCECFAEQFISGREFNLSVLADPGRLPRGSGPRTSLAPAQVLPPAEIDFSHFPAGKPQVVGYRAKWSDDSFEFHHTPRRFEFPAADAALLERLTSLAVQCWNSLGLRGYVRVDFRVDANGDPWILETNTNPCISPDAGFVAAAERAGIAFEQVVERILDDALCGFPVAER